MLSMVFGIHPASFAESDSPPPVDENLAAETANARSPAELLSPTPGCRLAGMIETFSWTDSASVYCIEIGSAPDRSDIHSSGVVRSTSYTFTDLPTDSSTVYVRLSTVVNGGWHTNLYTFTAADGDGIGNRAPRAMVTASSERSKRFAMENVADSVLGEINQGEWASAGEETPWIQLDWEETVFIDDLVLFDRANVNENILSATLSFSDGSSIELGPLPADGSAYPVSIERRSVRWARIQVNSGEGANVGLSEIQVFNRSGVDFEVVPAQMISPSDGSTLPIGPVTFEWNQPPANDAFVLLIGTAGAESDDILNSGPLSGTTYTFEEGVPPNGQMVTATLMSYSDGLGEFIEPIQVYEYQAAVLTSAELLSPTPGSQFDEGPITFTWNGPAGVDGFVLKIGRNGPGSADIHTSPRLQETSYTYEPGLLPTGEPINVTLESYDDETISLVEPVRSYDFTAPEPPVPPIALTSASLLSPEEGSQLPAGPITFTWNQPAGVDAFVLQVGTAAIGAARQDIHRSERLEQTTYTLAEGVIPANGEPITVTLNSYDDETQMFVLPARQYDFIAPASESTQPVPAVLLSPEEGSELGPGPVTFTWDQPAGVEAYILQIGTGGFRSQDIHRSPRLEQNSYTYEGSIPATGEPITVTLNSYDDDTQSFVTPVPSYTFTSGKPRANLISPTEGATLSGTTQRFEWEALSPDVQNGYQLWVGTEGVGSDNIDRQSIYRTLNTALVDDIPLDGSTIYVRLRTLNRTTGEWTERDYTFQAMDGRSSLVSVVTVFANNRVPINPLIYGVNNDWRRTTGENHTIFEEKLDDVGYNLIRYPGGFESEYYLWEAAGETPANRTPRWSNKPAVPGATPEQVLATSKARGVEPTFVLRTREYIEAVRSGTSRVNDTMTVTAQQAYLLLIDVATKVVETYKDDVKIWEIGNEWYNFFGDDAQNQASYATIAGAIARAVKTVDPTAQTYIVAEWEEPQRMASLRQQFEADDNWQYVDGLNVHIYAGDENEKHSFDTILQRMEQLKTDSGKDKLYVSEWNSSKAYTSGKIYMQGANLQIKHTWLMQRAGIEIGAIWPVHQTAITGLGLVEDFVDPSNNANTGFGDIFPSGTAFNWMSTFLVGDAVQVTEQRVLAAASRNGNELVVFLLGVGAGDQDVRINTAGFNATNVKMAQLMYRDVANSKGVASIKDITGEVSLVERTNGLNQARVRINPGNDGRGSDSEIIMLLLEGDFTNP